MLRQKELAWRRVELLRSTAVQLPSAMRVAAGQRHDRRAGVNYVSFPTGPQRSHRSVDEALLGGLEIAGIPVKRFSHVRDGRDALLADPREFHDTTVAHVMSSNLQFVAARQPRLFGRGRRMISVTYVENTILRPVQWLGLPFTDEIWTLSQFCAESYHRATRTPVHVLPFPVTVPDGRPGALRSHLGIGSEFLFAIQFDLVSTEHRKNPSAAIAAYLAAFPRPRQDTRLLVKTMNTDTYPDDAAMLRRMVQDRPDITWVDHYWPKDVNDAFFRDIDCYVSMHRSEGLGIGIAQAMSAGKPVIATGYSGNMDVMNDSNSIPIPVRLVDVGVNPVQSSRGTWAEPDHDAAVDSLRAIRSDSGLRESLGKQAASDLAKRDVPNLAQWIATRLAGP